MNFDNEKSIQSIDQSNYISEIRNLNKKILNGWEFAKAHNLAINTPINKILLVGFSEFLNVVDLLLSIVGNNCRIPIIVHNSSTLPKWCKGNDHLIVGLLKPSNENFVEGFFLQAKINKCSILRLKSQSIKTEEEQNNNFETWHLNVDSFSRSTVGFDVMLLSGLFYKLGLVQDLSDQVQLVQETLHQMLSHIDISVPSSVNPAKRLAGQMVGRWIKIVGGSLTKPIAQRWSDQINKTAKTMAWSEDIHQLICHSLTGIYNPENLTQQSMVVFLKSNLNEDLIELLIDKSKEELMCNGIGTDYYSLRGTTLFAQIWSAILFGDFVAYYLAMAYGCDPCPVAFIEV